MADWPLHAMIAIVSHASGNPWIALALIVLVNLAAGYLFGLTVGRRQARRDERRWLWQLLRGFRDAELFVDLGELYAWLEAALSDE